MTNEVICMEVGDMLRIKRVYDEPDREDGLRVLVDGLWPRGLSKDDAGVDEWLKELAPSDDLRKWFGHEPSRWSKFRQRYRAELRASEKERLMAELARRSRREQVTLLFAARDRERNNAVALREFLRHLGAEA